MNLHGIAVAAISAVNPLVSVTLQASAGYTTNDDGTQIPAYAAPVTVLAQVQALTYGDLKQLDGLNQTGDGRAVYLPGDWSGVLRPDSKGGDLMTIAGETWLVTQTMEQWPDWTKVAIVRQMP